jgi:TRAP-type C4-dicarboxylate transport system permease large subunit
MENIKKEHRHKLALGVILMLAGMLSAAFLEVDASVSIFLIVMGLVMFIITAFRLFRSGDLPDRDERTKKLASYGIAYSWILTLVLITVLYWIEFLDLAELTAETTLGVLLFFMIISANVFRWYFMRKGDIE